MAKQIIVSNCRNCPYFQPQVSFSGEMKYNVCISLLKSIGTDISDTFIFDECTLENYEIDAIA